jgi:hypothetical protein
MTLNKPVANLRLGVFYGSVGCKAYYTTLAKLLMGGYIYIYVEPPYIEVLGAQVVVKYQGEKLSYIEAIESCRDSYSSS